MSESTDILARKQIKRALLTIGLVLVVGTFLTITFAHNWTEFSKQQWHFKPLWLSLAILLFISLQVLNAELWGLILNSLEHQIHPMKRRMIWNLSLLARYVPTNTLMAVSRMTMSENEGVPKRVSLASIIYELSLTLFCATAMSAYFVITLPRLDGDPLRYLIAVVPFVGFICLHPKIFHYIADFVLTKTGRQKLPISLSYRQIIGFTALYTGSLIWSGLGVCLVAKSLYVIHPGDLPTIISAYSVAFTASVLAFVLPGGLGAREAAMATALTPVLPFAAGGAIAVVVRIIQFSIELLYAGVSTLLVKRLNSRAAGSLKLD